jgi:hypothetical protein
LISERRNEEPISTQPYLLTSPLKNEDLLVPFHGYFGSFDIFVIINNSTLPPSPEIIFFVWRNENVPNAQYFPVGVPYNMNQSLEQHLRQ